jgi:hypothetical protein
MSERNRRARNRDHPGAAGPADSALTANANPCRANLQMPTEFVGQNGALIQTNTKIAATGCGKALHAKHKRKKPRARSRSSR